MPTTTYQARRGQLETYFDDTAVEAWKRLTSDAPVSSIRATVRAGRDRMREKMLASLPADLGGARILDAGCGTGAMSVAMAARGAEVVAVDLAANLIEMARERAPADLGGGSIEFMTGDMLAIAEEGFDYVVAMDSLIHYPTTDIVRVIEQFAANTSAAIVFTFAPRTPALTLMHAAGRFFPRSDRAPAIEPVSERNLRRRFLASPILGRHDVAMSHRVTSGFYMSHAMELRRP